MAGFSWTIQENASDLTITESTVTMTIAETTVQIGGGGSGANLAYTASPTNGVVTSDSGTDATLTAADGTNAGLLLPAGFTKLAGIEAGADVTDAANVGAVNAAATSKATPVDADSFPIVDSEAANVIKRTTFTNFKAFLKTYFDTIYTNTSAVATQITTALSGYLTSATAASTYEPLKGSDDNFVTDAEKVKLSNLSGTNTGDNATNTQYSGLDAAKLNKSSVPCEFIVACSDETTAITTGTAKVTFRAPYAFTLTAVRASVTTAPTGSTIVIDINESGTSVLSTKLSIDASEKTSTTAATAAVISDSAIADDAEITIDFDQVGSTIAGAGVKVVLIGTHAV